MALLHCSDRVPLAAPPDHSPLLACAASQRPDLPANHRPLELEQQRRTATGTPAHLHCRRERRNQTSRRREGWGRLCHTRAAHAAAAQGEVSVWLWSAVLPLRLARPASTPSSRTRHSHTRSTRRACTARLCVRCMRDTHLTGSPNNGEHQHRAQQACKSKLQRKLRRQLQTFTLNTVAIGWDSFRNEVMTR